jgi:hypothetical protein
MSNKDTEGLVRFTFGDFLKGNTPFSLDRSGCNACQGICVEPHHPPRLL